MAACHRTLGFFAVDYTDLESGSSPAPPERCASAVNEGMHNCCILYSATVMDEAFAKLAHGFDHLAGPDAEEEDADADADGIRSAQVAREIYGADARAEVTLKPDGASRGGVRLSALHELVTWVMTDHGANPSRWAFVRNKPLVSRVVMLLAPGIDATRCVLSHTGPHTTASAW